MKTPLGDVIETKRQFQIIQFKDRYNSTCSLQQSSIADFEPPGSSAVWLGLDPVTGEHDGVFDAGNKTRMHLDLKQVKALIAVLEMWVETGSFIEDVEGFHREQDKRKK